MSTEKIISFLVPCYNSAGFMHICIESLLKAGNDAEIIIIDDGSTDDTGKIADEFAEKNPDIIKVIHQINAGHGGGINSGIRNATGEYFKVVDSDDWLNEKVIGDYMKVLHHVTHNEKPDLVITNYSYYHEGKGIKRNVRFRHQFPKNRIFGWEDTKGFGLIKYMMLHNATYRLEAIRNAGLVLPEKVLYEDNYMLYYMLPKCKRMYYADLDLYMYLIGRSGQSMSPESLARHSSNQVDITESILLMYSLDEIKKENKKLYKFMSREVSMLIKGAIMFVRKGEKNKEDYKKLRAIIKRYYELDEKTMKKAMKYGGGVFLCIPGRFGRWFDNTLVTGLMKIIVKNM